MKRYLQQKVQAISESGLTIYDPIQDGDDLFLSNEELESILNSRLIGLGLAFKLRTRSKVVKSKICEALGYPVPKSFQKTRPRFIGQDFDTYVQKSNNLQIWNQAIDPSRRYVLIRVTPNHQVGRVKVLTGEALAKYDKTGTLTSKFQARRRSGAVSSVLGSQRDTENFIQFLKPVEELNATTLATLSPTSKPIPGQVLSIAAVYARLLRLIGTEVLDPGVDQERRRGIELQRLVCKKLGLLEYADNGQFPDILVQALEVKFQYSGTVDLGLISPDSAAFARDLGSRLRHRDVRYAVIYAAQTSEGRLKIKEIILTSGREFFEYFDRFEGSVVNKKLQIPLPPDIFGEAE